MISLLRKNFKNIVLIVAVVFVAYLIIFDGDFSIIIDTIKQTHPAIFFVGMVMALLYYLLDGISLTICTRLYKKDYKLRKGMVVALIAPFFNGITPFSSGGQFAQVYTMNKQGVETTSAAGIMMMHFIVYQLVLVVYTFVILIAKFQYFKNQFSSMFFIALLGFLINFVVIITLFFGSRSEKLQSFIVNVVFMIGYKLHIVKSYELQVERFKIQLKDFREQFTMLTNNLKVLFWVVVINVVRLSINYLIPFVAFKALGYDVSSIHMSEFMGITALIYLITAFIPIPGASGGSEGVFTIMYGSLLGRYKANCGMLIWRFVTYYFMMLVGAIVFATNKDINNKGEKQ